MENQNFEIPRNGVTQKEALNAFKEILSIAREGGGPRNNNRTHEDKQQIIDRFIGKYSPKNNKYCSLLCDYDRFTKWAYSKLGYSRFKLGGILGWWNNHDKQKHQRKKELDALSLKELPPWCHTPRDIHRMSKKLAESE
jgi:hypothetical protein